MNPLPKTVAGALVLLLVASTGALGCANPIPYDQRRDTAMDVMPIFRSNRVRPQQVTYYLASIEQESETVTVDFDLSNGFSRFLGAVTTWVTLRGANGESLAHAHPVGPMAPHVTHHLIVRVPEVAFRVEDVELGVQIAP